MPTMTGKDFENLAQRSLNYFLATFPSFYPAASADVGITEQEEAYTFIKGIYTDVFLNPSRLGFKVVPDDSLGDRQQNKDKPALVTDIRKTIAKMEEFIALLWRMSSQGAADGNTLAVETGELDMKPAGIRQLAAFGVRTEKSENAYRFTFPVKVSGLKLLARISAMNVNPVQYNKEKPYLLFSRGVFSPAAPWTREVFGNMLADRRPFDRLIDFLEQNDFRRVDNKPYNNKISLDYICCYGSPEDELKAAFSERTHSGIEVTYEELKKNQFSLSLRLPYYKEILNNSGKMSEKVKRFVLDTTKKCDGCRYCVQTDKTGKRPLAHVTVENDKLCPFYPGFSYNWRTLDDTIVDDIIGMLQFIDTLFSDRKQPVG